MEANNALAEVFGYDIPLWVTKATKSSIYFAVEDILSGLKQLRVTIPDVAQYFAEEANSMSGCRTLAGLTGDWRNMDGLAQIALEYYKLTNIQAMRREGRKYGIEPRF